jgi:hypothetical protein
MRPGEPLRLAGCPEREPFGVHEIDVVDAEEAEEIPDISRLRVDWPPFGNMLDLI